MYKVTCLYQGTTYTLHDPESEVLRIYSDSIETVKNEPGSFKFSVSYDHPYLDKIVGLSSDIRVYDDGEEIFRCRPIDEGENLYRMRSFECEGELAFLYDSIQPRRELHSVTPLAFFTLLVEEHNAQVKNQGGIDKTFNVGVVTVTDSNNSLYRYTNRETTLEDIQDKIIDRLGGHLSVRITNGKRYLDLLADVETVGDQPIQLGENLLNYSKDTDYTDVATACIPLGEALEETEIAALDAYLTVADVNNGSDVIQIDSAVERYGFICKVVNFDDYTKASTLYTAGKKWLTDGQYASMTLTLTAVDLHTLGYDHEPIRVNTQVRVVSEPHGMDRYFEVTKRTYHLTSPETDTVEFGGSSKKSYTSSSHGKLSSVSNHAEQVRQNIDSVIDKEKQNVSDILNMATHGYVVLDPNDGPEQILIMDTNSKETAQKIWKWDMNGLGYSSTGIEGPWGVAITMNGEISADYILTGELDASLIKVGKIQDSKGYNYWDMETGEFQLAATTKVGDKTVSEIADDAVEAQTQTEIFNKLTNNGETQGIYLENGLVYINGTYISTGTITSQNGNTSWNLSTGTFTMKKGSISINNGSFSVSTTGAMSCSNADVSGTFTNTDGSKRVKIELSYIHGYMYSGSSWKKSGHLDMAATYADGKRHVCLYGYDYLRLQAGSHIYLENYTALLKRDTVSSGGHIVFASDGATFAYLSSSSKRYKNHVRYMDSDEAKKLLDIPVVWFQYKDGYLESGDRFEGKDIPGMYAEEVEEIIPSAVRYNSEGLVEDWNERMIIPYMIKMIQDLYKEVHNAE